MLYPVKHIKIQADHMESVTQGSPAIRSMKVSEVFAQVADDSVSDLVHTIFEITPSVKQAISDVLADELESRGLLVVRTKTSSRQNAAHQFN